MNNTELKELCQRVGKRLTDKPCQVRFQQPAYENAKGTACKRGRSAVIDIRPGMSSPEFLSTFLHELGHVKCQWGSWTVSVPDIQPGSIRLPDIYETSPGISLIEDAAKNQAFTWFQYSNEHAAEHEGSWLVSRLKALEHYQVAELIPISEEQVVQAVNAGVEQAMKNFKGR